MNWAFKLYDINNDGFITKPEMIQVIEAMMSLVEKSDNFDHTISCSEKVETIFLMMDEDGNGELSKEEFIKGARADQSVIGVLSLYTRP